MTPGGDDLPRTPAVLKGKRMTDYPIVRPETYEELLEHSYIGRTIARCSGYPSRHTHDEQMHDSSSWIHTAAVTRWLYAKRIGVCPDGGREIHVLRALAFDH